MSVALGRKTMTGRWFWLVSSSMMITDCRCMEMWWKLLLLRSRRSPPNGENFNPNCILMYLSLLNEFTLCQYFSSRKWESLQVIHIALKRSSIFVFAVLTASFLNNKNWNSKTIWFLFVLYYVILKRNEKIGGSSKKLYHIIVKILSPFMLVSKNNMCRKWHASLSGFSFIAMI